MVGLRNLALGGNVVALGLARHPRRVAAYVNANLFLWKTLAGARGLPQMTVFEALGVAPQPLDVTLHPRWPLWFQPEAWLTADLVNLCVVCRAVQPKVVFEIGTSIGYTSLHFALNSPPETKIYTLDLPPERSASLATTWMDQDMIHSHSREYLFRQESAGEKVTTLYGDSATFDFGPYRQAVDLFFIDGAHSYEYVKNDTEKALDCVRPGGVIAWHDYGRAGTNGVSRYLEELAHEQGRPVRSLVGSTIALLRVQ